MAANSEQIASNSIFHSSAACHQSFKDCLEIACLKNNDWAENRLAEFKLWAARFGASIEVQNSLDKRLAFEPELRAVLSNLLVLLKGFIEQCKELGRLKYNSTRYA